MLTICERKNTALGICSIRICDKGKIKIKIEMKTAVLTLKIFFLCLLLVEVGCESSLETVGLSSNASVYTYYAPVKIDIMPLTEFVSTGDGEEGTRINVYVSLLDSFGCQKKTPGVFRFELYEKVPRSAEPKGKRIVIWPDIDLTDAAENNSYWRDFLGAYEFNLDIETQSRQSCILQVTCLCPDGKRLLDEFGFEHTK